MVASMSRKICGKLSTNFCGKYAAWRKSFCSKCVVNCTANCRTKITLNFAVSLHQIWHDFFDILPQCYHDVSRLWQTVAVNCWIPCSVYRSSILSIYQQYGCIIDNLSTTLSLLCSPSWWLSEKHGCWKRLENRGLCRGSKYLLLEARCSSSFCPNIEECSSSFLKHDAHNPNID